MRLRFAEGGVLVVLALLGSAAGRGQQDAATLDDSDVVAARVELIALEEDSRGVVKAAVCSGSSCGLCNQPCADACCGTGNDTKPACCSQTAAPTITTPFIAARPVVSTPCPSCELCPSILAATDVEPGLAECCNARPCGSKQFIDNTLNGTNATSTPGVNPYGANWTYEKHVKKHGVDITKFAQTPLQKAAAAQAAKDAEEVANQVHTPPAPPVNTNGSSLNTSTTPGVAVVLLPPNVTVKDWELPPKDITAAQNSSDMDALMNSMPKANVSLMEIEEESGLSDSYVYGYIGAEGEVDVTDRFEIDDVSTEMR